MKVDFEQVKKWLIEGKKIRPTIWKRECYIYYEDYTKGCYDERGAIVDLRALSGEIDWEVLDAEDNKEELCKCGGKKEDHPILLGEDDAGKIYCKKFVKHSKRS